MKRLGWLFAIAACGGSAPKSKEPMVISECAGVAAHVSEAVFTWKEPPPTTKDAVARVINEHCEGDKWNADAKACFGKMTDEKSAEPCIKTLTEDQHTKVMNAMEATFDKSKMKMEEPAAAPAPGSVGGAPSKGADPCEGGE